MVTLRGKIARSFVRGFMNVNPKTCKDPIKKVRLLCKASTYKAPKGYTHEKINYEGLPIEVLRNDNSNSEKVVYLLHGGAYIAGMSDLYRKLSKKYSVAGYGATVVSIDYRVAPDHKYPSALDDAMKGWEWILKQGYQEENILILGDSAGGNLTLALMLKLRDNNKNLPCAAVCMSPWADMTASGESYFQNYNKDVMFGGKDEVTDDMVNELLNSEIFSFCIDEDRKNPYISPVFGDYKGFPPMLITVGEDEMLLSDSLTIYEKLRNAGADVTLHIGEGMFHVYPLINISPEAKLAMSLILEFISKHLS